MRVLHVAAGIDVEPQKKPTIRAVASSHEQIYGSSGLDESMSTTEMFIATVRCIAVTLHGIVASSRSTGHGWA